MTTESTLTDDQREDLYLNHLEIHMAGDEGNAIILAIEQAVLQSPEAQRLREDAERYRWLRKRLLAVDFEYGEPKCIALAFEMPSRDMVFSADCDANIDLGMEQQP